MSWENLAADPCSRKIYLVEIDVADVSDPSGERLKLRFSTDAIDPALTEHFYEPCISSCPVLTRSVQVLSLGRTAAAYGNLVLITAGGHLDYALEKHFFAGAPVSIFCGFGGLPVSEFREIFKGSVSGGPVWDDAKLTLPLADGVRQLLDEKCKDETLEGPLPTVLSGLLDAAGIDADKREAAVWDEFAAQNSFNVWLKTSENKSIGSALDVLLGPLCCWYGFGRDGRFRVGTFCAPQENSPVVLGLGDAELFKFSEQNHDKMLWKIAVSYYSATGANPVTAECNWENETIKQSSLAAKEISKKTLLTSEEDAQAVLERWKKLFSVRRLLAKVSAATELFKLNVGDCVRLTRQRFGVDHVYRVQKTTDDTTKNTVILELFR